MRTLTEAGSSLVIQSPLWLPLLLMGIGLALMALPFFLRPPRPYRLGALLGTILFLVAGWQLFTSTTTFEPRGFLVTGRLGDEERVGWLQVTGVTSEGGAVAVQIRSGGEIPIDVSGLSDEDKARVVKYVRSRVKP